MAPVACKFTYVDRKYLATSFGLKENRHTKFDPIGSTITINYTWNMFKNVSWRSRIYYFTNYKKALFEWENTFNLRINKYLSPASTTVSTVPKAILTSNSENIYLSGLTYRSNL